MEDVTLDRFDTDRWLQPDARMEQFLTLDLSRSSVTRTAAEDWLKLWKRGSLDSPVPAQIINLFEQARACICYGFFFYPLYTLGIEQLTRAADAAVAVRCEQLGAPKARHTFQSRIDWLAENGHLQSGDATHWHRLRMFRNEVSHHTRANVIPPGMAAPVLRGLARDIEALFVAAGGGV